jgi:hypothetical protein
LVLREALSRVPDGESVSATNHVGAHLSSRERVLSLPRLGDSAWVVLDTGDPWIERSGSGQTSLDPAVVRAFVDRMQSSPTWTQVFEKERIHVFRKTEPS